MFCRLLSNVSILFSVFLNVIIIIRIICFFRSSSFMAWRAADILSYLCTVKVVKPIHLLRFETPHAHTGDLSLLVKRSVDTQHTVLIPPTLSFKCDGVSGV